MLTEIFTQQDIAYLQKRFSHFQNSVVDSWIVNWAVSPEARVRALLRVHDYERFSHPTDEDEWSEVVLSMENCSSFRLAHPNREYYLIANGIHIIMDEADEMVFGIDFGHFNDVPQSFPQLMESPCCVVCSCLSWNIL